MTDTGRIILGIDPGTAATGFGVVVQKGNRLEALDFGVIRTTPDEPFSVRLEAVFAGVEEVLDTWRPVEAAVESLFFNVNVRTAFAVGQARGVTLLACSRFGCSVHEYTPQEVKQAVVGYGKADKAQVQEMVRVLLRLPEVPRPDHAADALGVAICHAHGRTVRTLIDRAHRKPSGAVRRQRDVTDRAARGSREGEERS